LRRSNRLVLLIGVFLAALVFVIMVSGIINPGGGGTAGASPSPTPAVVVIAKQQIPLGTTITGEMLDTQTVAPDQVPPGALSSTLIAVGHRAQNTISQGAAVLLTDVQEAGPNQPLVKIETPAGKRAMAVQVDQVSGVGTIIRKGDYVDAILLIDFQTTQIDQTTGEISVVEGVNGTSVKLLLQSMQVLGTLLPPAAAASAPPAGATPAPGGNTGGGTTLNGQQEIVILAVSPQQAEVLRFAQTGQVTLILRSQADFVGPDGLTPTTPADITTTGIVLKSLIDQYGVLTPEIIQAILPSPRPR
jgi:pilus assembly protein CpaB